MSNSNDLLPGEKLVDNLDQLRLFLEQFIVKLEESGVKRTQGLYEWKGRECAYYWKSLDLFLRQDYTTLRDMILQASDLIKECEKDVE